MSLATARPETVGVLLEQLGHVLTRLDQRKHVLPATLELSWRHGRWLAQIMAEPLYQPLAAAGESPGVALVRLYHEAEKIDWRKVKR